jgi:hypothetical protein
MDRGNLSGGVDVAPGNGVDAIVSRAIEQPGQHILRVEVGYLTAEGGTKTFRKFYRFQVSAPLLIKETAFRHGDSCCFVSVSVEYTRTEEEGKQSPIVIASSVFESAEGLSASRIDSGSAVKKPETSTPTAAQLLDAAGSLSPGGSFRYIFKVEASSKDALLRGIAAGDLLGRAVFTWRKAMGETGVVSSSSVYCPRVDPERLFQGVVHKSGLSVDVAADSASRTSRVDRNSLSNQLPVTVEPIDPPSRMQLNVPQEVQFLVVNHSDQTVQLQLQFRLSQMAGLAVCGACFRNLGDVSANGGSTVTTARFLPLAAGLLRVQGCSVVDLASGREVNQPPLFHVFVDQDGDRRQ